MKKNLFTAFIFTFGLFFCFQNTSAQFPIKIPKVPKVEKPKPEQPKNEEVKSNNVNNSQNNSNNSEQVKTLEVKQSSVGKIYFSNQPFGTTNDSGKTSFTTGDYIYGRLETDGKTLREAFGFAPISKENPENQLIFNLYAFDPSVRSSYGDKEGAAVVSAISSSPFVAFTEADLDKTYWNFDVLPDPAKAATRIYDGGTSIRVEDDDAGALGLYIFLKTKAEEKNYLVKIELVKKTMDFRGKPEAEDKWLTVEGRFSLNFKGADFAKIKANQEKMEANRLARISQSLEDDKQAALENEPLPKEWTAKSNPLLPGLTESNLRALFQKYGAHYVQKQIIKFYADSSGSTAKKVVYNDLGIPKYRSFDQWFTIFAKVKFSDGKESCFYQNFLAAQEYAGSGTYGNLILVTDNRVDISCAKLGVK